MSGMAEERDPRHVDAIIEAVKTGSDLEEIVDSVFAIVGQTDGGPGVSDERRRRMTLGIANVLSMNTRTVAPTFGGPILLVRTADTREIVKDPLFGWGARAAAVDTADVSSAHLSMLDPDSVPEISQEIKRFLTKHVPDFD